jgi:hypothetical protein
VGNRLLLLGSCSLAEPRKPREQAEACRPIFWCFSSSAQCTQGATTKHLAGTSQTRRNPWWGMPAVSLNRQYRQTIHLVVVEPNIESIR